ncbi:hypothetical protein RMATCC62417_06097 [Rhizopus microsporus]|nr:hypothetical protein RMATCC62417_06097 [Rhizopus microsporus]
MHHVGDITGSLKEKHDKETLKSEGKKASESLMKITKLMLTNQEFRSLLGELIEVSQDIFTNVTSKVGDSLQGAGDNLQDDQKQTSDRSGKDLVDNVLDRGLEAMDSRGNDVAGNEPRRKSGELLSTDPNDPRHVGLMNTGDTVHPSAIPRNDLPTTSAAETTVPPSASQTAENTARNKDLTSSDRTQEMRGQAEENKNKFKDKARSHLDEHKSHARQTVNEKLPQEKQDELIERLRLVLAQVQKHPDYQGAIETLIQLIKTWSSRLSQVSEDVKNKAQTQDHPEKASYRETAERELKAIIECWAQGQSIDPLLRGVQNVVNDMKEDQELRDYYNNVLRYVEKLMREPGYASRDESTDEGRRLMDRGHEVIRGKYDDHLRFLNSESRRYMNLMAEDEISSEISDRITTIHRDLWMDSEGNPSFKPHLLNDMKMTLLPAFIDEIHYIPVPRIEHSDRQFDVVVENLVISGDSLLPKVFDTKVEVFNSFSFLTDTPSRPSSQSLLVRMSEIQADVDDVVFWFNKKTGFPKMQDRGVASLAVGGKGISVVLRIRSVVEDPSKTFKVDYIKCNVDKLKVKVNDTHHDVLYKMVLPLVMGTIRRQMAKAIENAIVEKLNAIDQRVTRSIVDFHQGLQNRAYQALPESEKQKTEPYRVSQNRPRPGFWSTIVALINNNIKSKVETRNMKKQQDEKRQKEPERTDTSTRSIPPASIQTGRPHRDTVDSPHSPPLSPTKLQHDHSKDYKTAYDLSEAQLACPITKP